MRKPRTLYHCTTPKKAKACRGSGQINRPVRGFDTLLAAMAWCVKTGRTVIYEIQTGDGWNVHKLPDHHSEFGSAWWIDEDVSCADIRCCFSAVRNDHRD